MNPPTRASLELATSHLGAVLRFFAPEASPTPFWTERRRAYRDSQPRGTFDPERLRARHESYRQQIARLTGTPSR